MNNNMNNKNKLLAKNDKEYSAMIIIHDEEIYERKLGLVRV